MPETIVAEAPVIETPEVAEVETPSVGSEQAPSAPETETAEGAQPPAKEDGRSFAGKLRDHYKKLMASQAPEDKALASSIKDLFFAEKALKEKFPGGLKEIEERLAGFDKYGTPEQLESLQADAKTLEDIDTKWMNGDPAFMDELATLNAESFKKLAPVAINKFAQIDPEGYQRVMSGILSNTLSQAKMGDQLYLIAYHLKQGDAPGALALVGQIQEWMGKLDEAAKSVPPQQAQPNQEFEHRQQQLEEREAELFNQSLTSEFNGWRDEQIKSAVNKLTKGAKIDPERYEIFSDRVRLELSKMLPQDFQEKWVRLYDQKDKAALLKFAKAPIEANVSKAVAKIYSLLFPQSKPKTLAPPQTQTAQPKAEAGWIMLPKRPDPQQIDRGRGRTTDEMIFAGKAYLRDGRKVMWQRA